MSKGKGAGAGRKTRNSKKDQNDQNDQNDQDENNVEEPMATDESIPDPKENIRELLEIIKDGGEIDMKATLKTLFLMQLQNDQEKRVAQLESRMSDLEKQLEEKNEIIEDFESRLLIQEVESNSTKIVIRNLAMHKNTKDVRETPVKTRQIANEILKFSGITENVVKDTFRIYYKAEKNKKAKMPAMVIEFFSKANLAEFMSKISDIKKVPNLEKIQVDRFIPYSLMEEYEKASKEAFSLRKKGFKTKTIVTKFGNVLLLAKGPKDQDFEKQNY